MHVPGTWIRTKYVHMVDRYFKIWYVLQCTKQFEEQLKKEREDKQSSLSRLTSLGEVHQKQVDDLMKGLDEQHKLVKFPNSSSCQHMIVVQNH